MQEAVVPRRDPVEIEIGIEIGIFFRLFPGPLSKRILDHVDVPGP